ncbi:MAG: RAD55 family ATPase [Methanobacteriota archaeon]
MGTPLVKTFIEGLDQDVLKGGIPSGHVVVIRGASGTMKTSLAYYVLHENALRRTPGMYVTFEQTAGGLLEHAESLGLSTKDASDSLLILDLSEGREQLTATTRRMANSSGGKAATEDSVLSLLQGKMQDLHRRTHFSLLAIDSWSAIEALLPTEDRRSQIFGFFEWVRSLGTTTLVVSEPPRDGNDGIMGEEVLCDGIFEVVMAPLSDTTFQRRIQCVKMRCVNHDNDIRSLLFEAGRFEVSRAIG